MKIKEIFKSGSQSQPNLQISFQIASINTENEKKNETSSTIQEKDATVKGCCCKHLCIYL